MDLKIEFAHGEGLIGDVLADLVDLAAVFSEDVEQVDIVFINNIILKEFYSSYNFYIGRWP